MERVDIKDLMAHGLPPDVTAKYIHTFAEGLHKRLRELPVPYWRDRNYVPKPYKKFFRD